MTLKRPQLEPEILELLAKVVSHGSSHGSSQDDFGVRYSRPKGVTYKVGGWRGVSA